MEQERDITIGALLDLAVAADPEGPAVIEDGGKTLSYGEFGRLTDQAAAGLIHLGAAKGEHLALWAGNSADWLICQFAAAKAGVVLSTVEPEAEGERLIMQLTDSDARTLVYDPALAQGRAGAALAGLCPADRRAEPGRTDCAALPGVATMISLGRDERPDVISFATLLRLGREAGPDGLAQRAAQVRAGDVATLLYTSGTTGRPKGVLSSHGALVEVSRASAANMGLGREDKLCLTVPLHHMFGCVCVVLAGVAAGSAMVLPRAAMDPGAALAACDRYACSAIFGSPNLFLGMMQHPDYAAADVSALRTGIMGGASCPMEVMRRVVDDMGVRQILVGYGQTEASSWATQTRPEDPLELRVSTVGRALPGVETMIADPVSGTALPPGRIGEFRARGFNMSGYYKNPEATAEALDPDGWLATGDLATSDQAGYIRIVGRVSEVINRNGAAVYPSIIEEACYGHPSVGAAAAFGVSDPQAGEEVALWVKPVEGADLTPEDLGAFLAKRLPADHLPRYMEMVDSFPLTAVGKVQRFKMRKMFEAARKGQPPRLD